MEDVKLAYIAGIIDGEGSIMLVRVAHKSFMKQHGRMYPHYHPCVRVGMIDRKPMDYIVETTSLGKVEKEKSYNRQRPMFRWRLIRKKDVQQFLEIIIPFLLVKKEQALTVLDYMKNNVRCHRFSPMTPELEAWRTSYWIKMRTLNGIASPATTEPTGQRGRSMGVRIGSDSLNSMET